jgi:hypothetical protein
MKTEKNEGKILETPSLIIFLLSKIPVKKLIFPEFFAFFEKIIINKLMRWKIALILKNIFL